MNVKMSDGFLIMGLAEKKTADEREEERGQECSARGHRNLGIEHREKDQGKAHEISAGDEGDDLGTLDGFRKKVRDVQAREKILDSWKVGQTEHIVNVQSDADRRRREGGEHAGSQNGERSSGRIIQGDRRGRRGGAVDDARLAGQSGLCCFHGHVGPIMQIFPGCVPSAALVSYEATLEENP
jgi:hypothetical protein